MLKGVFPATKKDGTIYYRTSINYSGKHISLGSFASQEMAHLAYKEASQTLSDAVITIDNVYSHKNILPHEKSSFCLISGTMDFILKIRSICAKDISAIFFPNMRN